MSWKMIRTICQCIFQSTPVSRVVPKQTTKQTLVFHPSCLGGLFAAVLHDLALMNLDNKCLKTLHALLAAEITRWEVYLAGKARKDVPLFSLSSANPLFLLLFLCSPLQR